MDLLISLAIGLIAGAHVSTWGMYKDAPHEGFTWPKYFRSILLAGLVGVIIQLITGLEVRTVGGALVFFGVVYAIERLLLELWKSFLRVEDQSKYFIPMRFSILGRPLENQRIRVTVGVAVVLFLLFAVWAVNRLQAAYPDLPAWLVLVTIGSLGGWLTAFGGAWKDAPVEGFETLKFFRSPVISFIWAWLLAHFTSNWIVIGISAAGFSVAAIETYKTFFFPSVPRGKFAGKPILYPDILKWRYRFVPLYVLIWILLVTGFVVAFMQPHNGLI